MREQFSAEEIGQYGYTHWTDKPIDAGAHGIVFVPQTIADGWEAYCSCGQWRGFGTFYEFDTKEGLFAALKARHAHHIDLSVPVPPIPPTTWDKRPA